MAANIKFSQWSERFPPILCRLLARSRASGPSLSNEEICFRSKLELWNVCHISTLTSWNGVPWDQMIAFIRGCNVDFEDSVAMNRHQAYVWERKPTFRYLRRHQSWDQYYKPLLGRWLQVVDLSLLQRWSKIKP